MVALHPLRTGRKKRCRRIRRTRLARVLARITRVVDGAAAEQPTDVDSVNITSDVRTRAFRGYFFRACERILGRLGPLGRRAPRTPLLAAVADLVFKFSFDIEFSRAVVSGEILELQLGILRACPPTATRCAQNPRMNRLFFGSAPNIRCIRDLKHLHRGLLHPQLILEETLQ